MAYDSKVSIIVLGEMGVGKSSLLLRFAKNIFKEHLTSTIIIDCYHTVIYVKNKRVRLELWDTGGQERFKCVINSYFRKADGVLLVYDVTDLSSFDNLKSWFLKLKDENETAISILVGNKTDHLKGSSVEVSSITTFASQHNLVFYECSAKTGENVTEIFEKLTERVLESKETNLPERDVLIQSKRTDFTERMLESRVNNFREGLLESNETYLTERVLEANKIYFTEKRLESNEIYLTDRELESNETDLTERWLESNESYLTERTTTRNLETKERISTSKTKHLPPKETYLTERVLESNEIYFTEKRLESNETYLAERGLEYEIYLTDRELESNETGLTERWLESNESCLTERTTTRNLETKERISTSTTKQPPPKENVVLLHKTPPPPKKKKCRC